jgi:hypothetical protein
MHKRSRTNGETFYLLSDLLPDFRPMMIEVTALSLFLESRTLFR